MGGDSFAEKVVSVQVERVEGADAEDAARRHAELHFGGVGVDAPQETDQYYRLLVDRCFYVGGMGSKCQAEVITSSDYMVGTCIGPPCCPVSLYSNCNAPAAAQAAEEACVPNVLLQRRGPRAHGDILYMYCVALTTIVGL